MAGIVFISYARANEDIARRIEEWLFAEVNLPSFFDQKTIKDGHAWRNTIKLWLDTSFAVIVLVSKESMKSPNVTFEWSYAMGKGKNVVPLVIDSTLEDQDINDFLKDTQWNKRFINPTKRDYKNLEKLLKELHDLSNIPDEVQEAVKLARSPIPENQEHAINLLKEYPDESALRELRILAKDSSLAYRQIIAALALAIKTEHDDNDPIEGLVRVIELRSNIKLERSAINSLSKINTPEAADALHKLFDTAQSHQFSALVRSLLEMDTKNKEDIVLDLITRDDIPDKFSMIQYLNRKHSPKLIDVVIPMLENNNWNYDSIAEFYEMLSTYIDDRIPEQMLKAIDKYSHISYAHEIKIVQYALDGLVQNVTPELIEQISQRKKATRPGKLLGLYTETLLKMQEQLNN